MNSNIFHGELVRFTAENPDMLGKTFSKWDRDSVFKRFLDDAPPAMWSSEKTKEWIEKDLEEDKNFIYNFMVRDLEEDKLIGFVDLWVSWNHGDSWVGIGLGERDYWGNGYGTDAMKLMLRYAFTELNLHRVSLGVFEYNTRARKSYEKAGFKLEGRIRAELLRQGKRWDVLIMGILRDEWLGANQHLLEY